ncbi:hypothetical protein BDU57DRAFT_511485 [Ampelomyces quisqualis]|uniref:Uncharacterized protein n=1 Tax=Ampelomyces quisqualis TaxID=50730 RepID=A0A6A5QSV9_AMPQU|nr:hypothetical protein BDU57DRAFT_511485 [Ampelomyces quisqualis]
MGGKTFANVSVPRMSPAVYQRLSAECQAKLETLFDRVVVPRDAPGKADFGDIDFLVESIKDKTSTSSDLWTQVQTLLGAELYVHNGGSHSFAIPHPDILNAYAQIDVELSPGNDTPHGAELFAWTRFMKGDSDLLQILGIAHRALGILCNDQGLHIRIEQIEPYNKKKALLFLTRDPNAAMDFYGLDKPRYWAGFANETELFDWATGGRFFSPQVFEKRVEKNNDRARQAKRPMYRRFVEEYMPAHAEKNVETTWTREQVLEEAIEMFGMRAEYDAMMDEHYFKEAEEDLWKEVRGAVPVEGSSLVVALKGLRRWVTFENGGPQLATVPDLDDKPAWTKLMAPGSKESLLSWVKENWEAAKALEKARASAAKVAASA